jgi:hypothetical protein
MPTAEDDWMQWLSEAHRVVKDWEDGSTGRMLSVVEAALLADGLARALRRASEMGLASANANRSD